MQKVWLKNCYEAKPLTRALQMRVHVCTCACVHVCACMRACMRVYEWMSNKSTYIRLISEHRKAIFHWLPNAMLKEIKSHILWIIVIKAISHCLPRLTQRDMLRTVGLSQTITLSVCPQQIPACTSCILKEFKSTYQSGLSLLWEYVIKYALLQCTQVFFRFCIISTLQYSSVVCQK